MMSWLTSEGDSLRVRFAQMQEDLWSKPVVVAQGADLFVNWADFPSLAPFGETGVAVHWLRKSGRSGYDYNVELAISEDFGATWSDSVVPHSDRSKTQHGFVTMSGAADGTLDLLWLDGRAYGQDGLDGAADATQLRANRITAEGKLGADRLVDIQACSCCQVSSARSGNDTLLVAYRDRTDAEIRDISVVRLENDDWSAPTNVYRDGWEISGCPVNGPAIAAEGSRVTVAWFTGADDIPAVKVAFSQDEGRSFAQPIRVDLGDPLGRVDAIFLDADMALVTWLEWQDADEVLYACLVEAQRGCIARQVLARNESSGSMNFPKVARIGQDVYFAWTQQSTGGHDTVRVARGRLAASD